MNIKFLIQAAVGAFVLSASSAALAQPVPINVTQMPSYLEGAGLPNYDTATTRLYPPTGGSIMLYDGDTLVGYFMQPGFVNLVPDHVYGIAVMNGTTMTFNSGLLVRKGLTDVTFADAGAPNIQYYPSPTAYYDYAYRYGYNYGYGYPYPRPHHHHHTPTRTVVVHHHDAPANPPAAPLQPRNTAPTAQDDEATMTYAEARDLARQMRAEDGDRAALARLKDGIAVNETMSSRSAVSLIRALQTPRAKRQAAGLLKEHLSSGSPEALDRATNERPATRMVAPRAIGR
jgi:hypothetical protein